MIDGIYFMQSGRLLFHHVEDPALVESASKIMMPFLTALDMFTRENFHAELKALIVDDEHGNEKRVFFKDFDMDGSPYKIVAIIGRPRSATWFSYWEVSQKMQRFVTSLSDHGLLPAVMANQLGEGDAETVSKAIKAIFF